MPDFIPGLQLSEMFYRQAVQPILAADFPHLNYSAALMGYGSDVLGYDTPMSRDHNWGPRMQLFLSAEDHAQHKEAIHEALRQQLPHSFQGYSVHFSAPDQEDGGTQIMETRESGPVEHLVEIVTLGGFFESYLGVDVHQEIDPLDWLTFPEQELLEITGGEVFDDGLGELIPLRARLAYYPRPVWLYRLASQWKRVAQEEAFMGRCGDLGDELGSRIIAARLVRDLMKLGFLIEKQYAPYSKWLGTAFSRLACGDDLVPIFNRVLQGETWQAREKPLVEGYVILAEMHNALDLTEPLNTQPVDFFNRPYQVLFAERFTTAIKKTISEEAIQKISFDIGGIDQFADSTDLTDNVEAWRKLRGLYE